VKDTAPGMRCGVCRRIPTFSNRVARDTRLLQAVINLPAHERDTPMLRALESRLALLLQSQPAHPDRQVLLAKLQLRLGDHRAAGRSVRRALRARPDYPQALRLRATLPVPEL